jgi:hypothetical protein
MRRLPGASRARRPARLQGRRAALSIISSTHRPSDIVLALERFPITWNHVIDKKSFKIKTLKQVLIEKVCQLFRNLL